MTRVLVIADTHMPRKGRVLPQDVIRAAAEADLIAHLGDFTGAEVLLLLERLAPVVAVQGNNDSDEIRARFPLEQRITIGDKRIALLHGHVGGRTAQQAALQVRDADIVLFGHSHHARLIEEAHRILLNPGSPTERRFAPFASYGMLTIDGDARANIVRLT